VSAPPTAHAGLDMRPRRPGNPRELVHAILDGPLRVDKRASLGVVDRVAGEAVCGEPGELGEFGEPPIGLWEPAITCAACAVLVRAWSVELTGCSR